MGIGLTFGVACLETAVRKSLSACSVGVCGKRSSAGGECYYRPLEHLQHIAVGGAAALSATPSASHGPECVRNVCFSQALDVTNAATRALLPLKPRCAFWKPALAS